MRAARRHSIPNNSSTPEYQLTSSERSRVLHGHNFPVSDSLETYQHKKRRMIKQNRQIDKSVFACPFYKFDPVRYLEKDVRCSSFRLGSIPRLKQHLYEAHWTPHMNEICPTDCSDTQIRSASAVGKHAARAPRVLSHGSKRVCDASKDLTDDQYLEIKVKRPRENKEDSWYRLFATTIPGAELPASPYVEPSNRAPRFFEHFRAQGPEDFKRRIQSQIRERVQQLDQRPPAADWTNLLDEISTAAVTTVHEEFLRASVRNEGGRRADPTDPRVEFESCLPPYSTAENAKHGEILPTLNSGTHDRVGWTVHDLVGHHNSISAALAVAGGGYADASVDNTIKTKHRTDSAWSAEVSQPQALIVDNNRTVQSLGEPAHSIWDDLDDFSKLPDYEHEWPPSTPGGQNGLKGPKISHSAPFVSQDFSTTSHSKAVLPKQEYYPVPEGDKKKPPTKASGKAKRPMSCLTIKGPNRDKCPPGCQMFKSLDIYSVQRHEKDKHGDLYDKHQEVLLAGLGKKKDAETRWLAHFEIITGGKNRGDVDPYFSPPDFDDNITAASRVTPSQLANTFTPAELARTQTYKILQDMIIDSFDASKSQLERHRQEAASGITSHIRRVLDQHTEHYRTEKALAKCQAISALRRDFENGLEIKPEEVVARYTSRVSWSPFDVREVLADVGNAYPDVSFLETDATGS